MRKFFIVLSILACTLCVSEIANAQTRTYTQLPECPGRWILDGRDATTNYVHCECPDGSTANDYNGLQACPVPQSETTFQQPAQTDPAQDMMSQMLGSAASQFGSQIGDALGRRVTKHW